MSNESQGETWVQRNRNSVTIGIVVVVLIALAGVVLYLDFLKTSA